jgi:hypothetical protein
VSPDLPPPRPKVSHVGRGRSARAVNGGAAKFQNDPHWQDCIQFFEYFHGDNGAGLGASHQTGWTGVIARILDLFGSMTSETMIAEGRHAYFKDAAVGPAVDGGNI